MSKDTWYFRQGLQERGPFSLAELREKAARGEIQPETMVTKGTGAWISADRFQSLATVPDASGDHPIAAANENAARCSSGASARAYAIVLPALACAVLAVSAGIVLVNARGPDENQRRAEAGGPVPEAAQQQQNMPSERFPVTSPGSAVLDEIDRLERDVIPGGCDPPKKMSPEELYARTFPAVVTITSQTRRIRSLALVRVSSLVRKS